MTLIAWVTTINLGYFQFAWDWGSLTYIFPDTAMPRSPLIQYQARLSPEL